MEHSFQHSKILLENDITNINSPQNTEEIFDYDKIIVKFIKDHLYLNNNNLINSILDNMCLEIEKDKLMLKEIVLELEILIFETDHYVCNLVQKSWLKYKSYLLEKFKQIDKTNFKEIFKFFLLMIHNFPYFLPYSDNVQPGCNRLFINNNSYKKHYYEDRLGTNNCYYHMRIYNWLKMDNNKPFKCYCERFF